VLNGAVPPDKNPPRHVEECRSGATVILPHPTLLAMPPAGVTRRDVLRLVCLAAGASLVSACQFLPGAAPTAVPSASEPQSGGTLTWGTSDIIDDINPTTFSGFAAAEILNHVLDGLVVLDADQNVYPHLATRWSIEDSARRYTFTLREDVRFHDGTPFTAVAVKRSWERWLDPRNKAATELLLLGPIDAIDAPDAKTLIVRFTQPNPLFLLNTWRPYFGPLSPKQLDVTQPGEKITAPIGTGPFKLVGRSADGVVSLTANADYAWADDLHKNRKAPYVHELRFRSIPEQSTRLATLESGESLLIDDLPEADYVRLAATGRYRFVEATRTGPALGFFLNVQRPPTDDLNVRQALSWAVDRQNIVDHLFFGRHTVAVGPLSEGVWSRLDTLETTYSHDPARARQILDTAGWTPGADGIRQKDGQKLSLVLATFRDPWTQIAIAVQANAREVGIDLQVQMMARGPYLDFIRRGEHHLCASAGTNLDPDELRSRYHSANIGVSNFSNLSDPALDEQLTLGSGQVMGSAERRQTYATIQQRLMALLPFVSVMSQHRLQAMSARVHGFTMRPDALNADPIGDVYLDR
jgi:peptide/nickel transport system substrate-binding protein